MTGPQCIEVRSEPGPAISADAHPPHRLPVQIYCREEPVDEKCGVQPDTRREDVLLVKCDLGTKMETDGLITDGLISRRAIIR